MRHGRGRAGGAIRERRNSPLADISFADARVRLAVACGGLEFVQLLKRELEGGLQPGCPLGWGFSPLDGQRTE